MRYKTYLVGTDFHMPAHDKDFVRLWLDVGRQIKPDGVILLGDIADCHHVSRYTKHPSVTWHLNDEVAAVDLLLDQIRTSMPSAKAKVYIEGNHEARLASYIGTYTPEVYRYATHWEDILNLKKRGWEFHKFRPSQLYRLPDSSLYLRHCPIKRGVNHSKQTAVFAGHSLMYGDLHTIAEAQHVTLTGEPIRSMCIGWGGDKNNPAFAYLPTVPSWNLGFATIIVDTKTGLWYASTHHVIEHDGVLSCRVGTGVVSVTRLQ